MAKHLRPSLVYFVPIFALLLHLCLFTALFYNERYEQQNEAITAELDQVNMQLLRGEYILESSLAIYDAKRIEQELSLTAADPNITIYTILNQDSSILFSNHIVWRGSQADQVIDGYNVAKHRQVMGYGEHAIEVNYDRLSIQAYYPLKVDDALNDNNDYLIYLEYDISPLLNQVEEKVFHGAVRGFSISLLGVVIFLALLNVYIVAPLRKLASQVKSDGDTNSFGLPKPLLNLSRISQSAPSQAVPATLSDKSLFNFKEIVGIRKAFTDVVSKLHAKEQQLTRSEKRWYFAVEVSRNGIWDWNLKTGEIFLSERWKEMLGYGVDELKDELSTWEMLLHPEEQQETLALLNQHMLGEVDELESVYRMQHKLGHYVWVLNRGMVVDWNDHGAPTRIIGTHTDVSEDVKNQQTISHHLKHDLLTNLFNRRSLMEELYRLKDSNTQGCAALFVLDIDSFTMVNDALGRHQGDRLLIQIAARLTNYFSGSSTIARLGADEFVVLMTDLPQTISEAKAYAINEVCQTRQLIGNSFQLNDKTLNVSTSIGVCVIDNLNKLEPDLTLKHAYLALQQAKEQGRDTYALYGAAMELAAEQSLIIQSDLRNAIKKGELSLVFQPIVDKGGNTVCAEALLRWEHPLRGNIPPADFIPIAEGSGLIIELGDWVTQQACRFVETLKLDGIPLSSVAINVSARQFGQSEFVESLLALLQQRGLSPEVIELELTEYALLTNLDTIRQRMLKLKDAGISIAIDDFGTGYSSLSYLQSLPLSRLKLDAEFVRKIGCNDASNSIVKAIIEMAHNLSLKVVAEGVETQQQFEFLRQLGCDTFQGYLFSRPLVEKDFIEYLNLERCATANVGAAL